MGEIRFTSEFFIVVLMYTQSFCRDNELDIFIFIPSALLVFCIAMDIYSKRMNNCKKASWLDSFKEAPLLKGVLMEVGSPLVLYLLFLGWDIMEKNAFLSWFLICVSLLYYMVMIAFFVIVRRQLNHPSYRRKR